MQLVLHLSMKNEHNQGIVEKVFCGLIKRFDKYYIIIKCLSKTEGVLSTIKTFTSSRLLRTIETADT